MAYNPGVSFFVSFYELDPAEQSQCIFFTQKGGRCSWQCQESDHARAILLHNKITAMSVEAVSLNLLQDYVQCNRCRSGRARHRDRIEDIGLLTPLAQRWQEEIWASPRRYVTTYDSRPASLSSDRSYARSSFRINATPSNSVVSSSSSQYGSASFSVTAESLVGQSHHNLRSRGANISARSISTQPPLSEFRPHIADPLPSDTVSCKIGEPLDDRDLETGSLYIFDRASSVGHVKIGWTARSVSRRLDDWSRCGYEPNLLFSVHNVPHAQRAETLTHHELIKEWRRERQCRGCSKSHQEWFEISKERAAQVLGDWADFMIKAEPYDSSGELQDWWKKVIGTISRKQEMITAKKLLEHYEASLLGKPTLVEELADMRHAPKVKEEVGIGCTPKVEHLEASEEAGVGLASLLIAQQTLSKGTLQLKSESTPQQIALLQKSVPQSKTQPQSDQLFKEQPIPKTEPLPKSNSVYGDVLASDRIRIKKELLTEQIPPPSSPLPQSTISLQAPTSLSDIKISRSTGKEEPGVMHNNTIPDSNISILDTEPNTDIKPSASTSASTSLSIITSTSATANEDIPETNSYISTGGSNITKNSPPLSSSDSSPESNPSCSSITISSPPNLKADPASGPPASPLRNEASEASLSPSTDTKLEANGAETRASTIEPNKKPQQNTIDGDAKARSENWILRRDTQSCEEEMKPDDRSESTGALAGGGTESETGLEWWDTDYTLVEDQVLGSLEGTALKIVNSLCDDLSTGKFGGVQTDQNTVKLLESETPSAVEAVAQA